VIKWPGNSPSFVQGAYGIFMPASPVTAFV